MALRAQQLEREDHVLRRYRLAVVPACLGPPLEERPAVVVRFRDRFGQWDPKNQRPELWNLYNCRIGQEESIRVFPLSNWTELDIWMYIQREGIPVVPLYFAQERLVVPRGEQLIPVEGQARILPGEVPQSIVCRFRTLGCSPCTGAVKSLSLIHI